MCADPVPDSRVTSRDKIKRFNPTPVSSEKEPVWQRCSVVFYDDVGNLIVGSGCNNEEAAANALAKMKQGIYAKTTTI